MSPEERTLPLFPLNTVLFPDAALPLQIFEERYKLLLQNCLDGDSRFGVVLIKAGTEVGQPAIPHSIGTLAHIIQVNEIRGGRFFVSIRGERRFRIKNITQYRPYITAQVELLDDSQQDLDTSVDMSEVRHVLTQYRSLITGLEGGWISQVRVPSDPIGLSYQIAGMLQIDLSEKQNLLEEPSAAQRLHAELEVLKRDMEPLKKRVSQELRQKFSKQ